MQLRNLSLLADCNQTDIVCTKLTSFVGNVRAVLGVDFDKIRPVEAETHP